MPADLGAATTVGDETAAEEGGMTAEQVEAIWEAALSLYRSGVHPALQLCLRRDGRVVLNRAIGHARGNGPDDDAQAPKVLASAGTPARRRRDRCHGRGRWRG